MSEAEIAYAERASAGACGRAFTCSSRARRPTRWRPALHDSPAGLAAWLVDKYRRWSDCDGEVERRFSKDDLCDFLTLYWATDDDRLLDAALRRRGAATAGAWRRASGSRCRRRSPTSRPRSCARRAHGRERVLADLRRWTEFDRGGHFAAFEEPELLADDLLAFLDRSERRGAAAQRPAARDRARVRGVDARAIGSIRHASGTLPGRLVAVWRRVAA